MGSGNKRSSGAIRFICYKKRILQTHTGSNRYNWSSLIEVFELQAGDTILLKAKKFKKE